MGHSASDISSSDMYVQVLQYVECALPYKFIELWCVENHHITTIGSHHTKKVVSSTSRFRKKGNISRTEKQKCPKAILFWMFRMCRILVNMVSPDDSMPKKFYCISKLGYAKKMKLGPHVGDCASKGLKYRLNRRSTQKKYFPDPGSGTCPNLAPAGIRGADVEG